MADVAEIANAKKRRSAGKGKFHRIYNMMIGESTQGGGITVLEQIMMDLENAYKDLEAKSETYLESLDPDDQEYEEKTNTIEEDMKVIYAELCNARTIMAKLQAENLERHERTEWQERLEKQGKLEMKKLQDENRRLVEKHNSMRVRRLDAPTFSGTIRDYPSFRKNYQTHIESFYGKDTFALKHCLSGEALSYVEAVDDDYEEMMRRLDFKYGRPEKLVDVVLNELKGIKKFEDNDSKRFIQLVNTIEKGYLDLKRVNLHKELSTTSMLSQFEQLLPYDQKYQWALIKQKFKPGEQQFENFLEFLREHRNAVEYMEEETRKSSVKGKVNLATKAEHDNEPSEDPLQKQIAEIVKGLAHITNIVTNQSQGDRNKSSNWCFFHGNPGHEITKCIGFGSLNLQERIDCVKKKGACFCCLKVGHIARDCSARQGCNIVDPVSNQMCQRYHHPLLHASLIQGTANVATTINDESLQGRKRVLLMYGRVSCKGKQLTVLYDPGSSISLISREAAKELQLRGSEVTLSITKVGNTSDIQQSKEHVIPLTDIQGRQWRLLVCEIDEITAEVGSVDSNILKNIFPEVDENDLELPSGKVDLLIGADCCNLLPVKIKQAENLQLMKGPFGYCVRGYHSNIKEESTSSLQGSFLNIICGNILHVDRMSGRKGDELKLAMDRFFNIETLGIQCSPKCGRCLCGKCAIGSNNYTIEEEKEFEMIKHGLQYDAEMQSWTSSYPWKISPQNLPNNILVAINRLKSLERRLQFMGRDYAEMYHRQIIDMLERKAAKKMDANDMSYSGPIHYIPHHEVLKESASTPMRIVFNSSASYMGHKLNDYWAKGPSVINDMLSVILMFRQDYVAVIGDISKMYNSIKLSSLDQHTHRFLWRDLDTKGDFDHYLLTTVTFGDKPSGTIAIAALRMTADLSQEQFPEECKLIKDNSYVDDILLSVEDEMTARKRMKNIETLLLKGGFKMKHWIMSGLGCNQRQPEKNDGKNTIDILQSVEERVLGMTWNPKDDVFEFHATVNLNGENNCKDSVELETNLPEFITRRIVLSQLAKVYDPLGLLVPVLLSAKVLMRNMCCEMEGNDGRGWDIPIDKDMQEKWIVFFKALYQIQNLRFKRCVKPSHAIGNPILVIFSDASNAAYGCCAYIRWQIGNNSFDSCLLVAKSRIAPKRQMTIPRLELCGAVLAARLRERVVNGMSLTFDKIYHITDSTIVRWQIQKESYGFKTFVATRVGEVQTKTSPEEWWWIKSDLNPADLTTRSASPSDLSGESMWQKGPDFLKLPVALWPISKEIPLSEEVPDRIHSIMTTSASTFSPCREMVIPIRRFSRYQKLLWVTALVINILKQKSFKGITKLIDATALDQAEELLIKHAQKELETNWKNSFRRLAPTVNERGIVMVGKRMSEWLKSSWNNNLFILLPSKGELSYLYAKSVHEEDHCRDVDVTVVKIRRKFWIPKLRNLVKRIRNKCCRCRLRDKELEVQEMGLLPVDRLVPAPPFSNTVLDFFGPFLIRDTVKRRVKCKVFGVLYSSSTEHAVHLDLSEGYDTDSYLMVQRRFFALRGYPRRMRSDLGSQLVCASKELKEVIQGLEWHKIGKFGAEEGMLWEFSKSADAPWENGLSEALVKLVKRNLKLAVGHHILTFSELQTVLFEVANLLNERPIGMKSSDPNDGTYLCPNDLLLGRASNHSPRVSIESVSIKRRWIFIQEIVDIFWRKWMISYFHTLIIRQKWHVAQRNVRVGDVVLIQDVKAPRGDWRLGEIQEAKPGKDGLVRDVVIRYKNQQLKDGYDGQLDMLIKRSVHRLIVIVAAEERPELK